MNTTTTYGVDRSATFSAIHANGAQEVIAMNNEPKESDAVAEINRLHQSYRDGLRTTLQTAIRLGELLTAEKAKCGHGNWMSWIKANLNFSVDTAGRYMNCFHNRALANSEATRNLTVEEFLKLTVKSSKQRSKTTPIEKARIAIRENPALSNNALSKIAGVSDHTIAKAKKEELGKTAEPKAGDDSKTKAAHKLLLKAFKAFWKNHSGAMIESSRMPALIKEFYKMSSLGTLEEVEAAWVQFKPTVCSETFTIRI